MLYNLNLVFTSHHIGTISDLKSPVPRLRNACWYLTAIDNSAITVNPPTQDSRKITVTCEEYNSRVNSLCFYSSLHNVTASLLITLLSVHALAYSSTDRLRKTPTN